MSRREHKAYFWIYLVGIIGLGMFFLPGAVGHRSPQTVSEVSHHGHSAQVAPSGAVFQAITHITLIDPGKGADEREDMTILIRDSRIVAVQKSTEAQLAPGTLIHDERGRYVMPGLWDAHVHLTQVGPKAFPLFSLTESQASATWGAI